MSEPVQLRVALAQVDTRVGDLSGNAELVLRWTRTAQDAGAHLVVFPEMTLTGYPPEDLVLRESFAKASEHTLVDLAADLEQQGLGGTAVVVGYLAHTEGAGPAPVDESSFAWQVLTTLASARAAVTDRLLEISLVVSATPLGASA